MAIDKKTQVNFWYIVAAFAGVLLLGRIVEELHQVAMIAHGGNTDANILIRDFEARAATKITK